MLSTMSLDQHPHPIFNDDDLDDDDDDSEPLINPIPGDTDSSSDTDDTTTVTVAIPTPTTTTTTTTAVTVALPDPKRHHLLSSEKKPIDDSRRLFQRLWTDEDEIELLQGFLNYTSSRGTAGSSHHHDTAAFYDQIKSKLQLDFNKNQLVEKLRRLKKKYRTVLSKINSGKDFSFKSVHDQSTFEISRQIWSNLEFKSVEFDDDDHNPNPNPNANSVIATPLSTSSTNGGYYIGNINLNNAATPLFDSKTSFTALVSNMSNPTPPLAKLSTRKRPRVDKVDDKFIRVNLVGTGTGNDTNNNSNNVNAVPGPVSQGNSAIQGLIEETVRSSISPMLKDLINSAVSGSGFGGNKKVKGVEELAMNAIPLNFPCGEMIDEKWRKQQILELEVYSKRLELVQDQIKSTLEELKSNEKAYIGTP